MALFVGVLSSTIVSNALPRILGDLGGTQAEYTWVVSASLLAMTASTPIWGKLADLYSKKLLVQAAIGIFLVGSLLCGLAVSTGQLIGFRVLQGLGMGGLQALTQVVIAAIITPRERGRYMGYLSGIMSIAVVGGPLLGGIIVDSPLGWRWCFFVGVPLAALSLLVLQRTSTCPPPSVPTASASASTTWVPPSSPPRCRRCCCGPRWPASSSRGPRPPRSA